MKKSFFILFKILLLGIIIFWLSKIVNIQETINTLKKIDKKLFLIAFLFGNLSNLFLTLKWYRLAKPLGIHSSFFDLLQLNYISMFYSIFFPGQASGELIKGIKLQKNETGHPEKVWAPIFIDKITNLFAILTIGTLAIIFDKSFNQNNSIISTALILIFLFFIFIIVLFTERINFLIEAIKALVRTIIGLFRIKSEWLNKISLGYFKGYRDHKLIILETILWSFLTKAPHIFSLYFLGKCLSLNISIIESSWLFSIISIATLIPISFSGCGIREGTVIFFMSKIGIASSKALSFSLLIFTVGILVSLIGGIFEFINLFKGNKIKVR